MIHSGSRSPRKTICDAFHKPALAEKDAMVVDTSPSGARVPLVGTDAFVGYAIQASDR
jgi:hypothetical protein